MNNTKYNYKIKRHTIFGVHFQEFAICITSACFFHSRIDEATSGNVSKRYSFHVLFFKDALK